MQLETPETPKTLRVMIVDDHEVVALGLQSLLEAAGGIEVVASVRTVADAAPSADKHRPDVVLMDYRLPDGTGVDAARQIIEAGDAPGIVMITSAADRRVLGQALEAGCCGFVSKNADSADLVKAVRAGAQHEPYFTRDVLKHLVHLKRFDDVEGGDLTDREVEILQATANGQTPEQIAEAMFLSAHTIKNHIRRAMGKLDAHTKLEAVVKAIRARVISVDEASGL